MKAGIEKKEALGFLPEHREPLWRDKNVQPGRADKLSKVMRIGVCPFFDRVLLVARLAGIEDMETRERFCGQFLSFNFPRWDDMHESGRDETKMACNEAFFVLQNQLEVVAEKVVMPETVDVDLSLGVNLHLEKVAELKAWLAAYEKFHRRERILETWKLVLNGQRASNGKEPKEYAEEELIRSVSRILEWLYKSALSDSDPMTIMWVNKQKCPQAPERF